MSDETEAPTLEENEPAPMENRSGGLWKEWVKPFLMVAIVVFSLRSAIADWNDVPTGSMRPSIIEGDRIFVNKLAYDLKVPFTTLHIAEWADPSRGDIVVFFSPEDRKRLVKRIVGLPGDRIEMRRDRLFINGELLEYQRLEDTEDLFPHYEPARRVIVAEERLGALSHPVVFDPERPAMRQFAQLDIPAGHFFVMGDNRDNSKDSRIFGPVPRERIVGRATAVAASLDPERYYLPRWNRFFMTLP